jgi:hypothetical protein
MTHRHRNPAKRSHKGTIAALSLPLVAVLGVMGTWVFSNVAGADATPTVASSAASAQTLQGIQQVMANLPKPSIPASQRSSEYQSALSEAECMQANGVPNYPLPNPNYGNGATAPELIGAPGSGVDVGSPAYLAAEGACSPYPNHGTISTTPPPNAQ